MVVSQCGLIFISLVSHDAGHSTGASSPSIHLPWQQKVSSIFVCILFLFNEFQKFFMHSEKKYFVRRIIYKYFLQSVTCLFILSTVSFREEIFKFWQSPTNQFLCLGVCCWCDIYWSVWRSLNTLESSDTWSQNRLPWITSSLIILISVM